MPDESTSEPRITCTGLDLSDSKSFQVVTIYVGPKLLKTFRGRDASERAAAYVKELEDRQRDKAV